MCADVRETVDAVYEEAVEAFVDDTAADGWVPDVPEYRVVEGATVSYDADGYAFRVGEGAVEVANRGTLRSAFHGVFERVYEEALAAEADPAVAWLDELYSRPVEVEIDETRWADLDGSRASYSRDDRLVKLDEQFLPYTDPEDGQFTRRSPFTSMIHECEHARTYQMVPAAKAYRADPPAAGPPGYGDDLEYKEDIRFATLEEPTTFVQWLAGYGGRKPVHRAIEDPWGLPAFFDTYLDLYGPREKGTVRDPYGLGLFTARSVLEEHVARVGPSAGLERTLDRVYDTVETPEEMCQTLEASFAFRDQPNYPLMLRQMETTLDAADPAERAAAEQEGIMARAEAVDDPDAALGTFLHAEAFLTAVDAVDGAPRADAYTDVRSVADILAAQHAPDDHPDVHATTDDIVAHYAQGDTPDVAAVPDEIAALVPAVPDR